MDVLRVVHDRVLDRWFQGINALLLLDDVRHACGSVQHEALQNLCPTNLFAYSFQQLLDPFCTWEALLECAELWLVFVHG